MKDKLLILFLATVLIVIIAVFIFLRIPITTANATLIVGIGALLSAIVGIFSIKETRVLAGLSIYPNLRIGSTITQAPDQAFLSENMCSTYVYLENLGPGIAKEIRLELTEYNLKEGSDPKGYTSRNDLIANPNVIIRKASKDFLAPSQTVETPYSMSREAFRTWFLFSPFSNQISAFVIENKGHPRFFILTIRCKNMRNEEIEPSSYLLQGLPIEGKNPDYAEKWLCWRIYTL